MPKEIYTRAEVIRLLEAVNQKVKPIPQPFYYNACFFKTHFVG